jgi:hypothetical protein
MLAEVHVVGLQASACREGFSPQFVMYRNVLTDAACGLWATHNMTLDHLAFVKHSKTQECKQGLEVGFMA